MRSKEDVQKVVAEILTDLRQQAGVSRAKMADRMNLDARTYTRYEAGESTPTLADFIAMLDSCGVPVLPTLLQHIYPESFGKLSKEPRTDELRRLLADFILKEAPDRDIWQLSYIFFGQHGSPMAAQLQLFCALDHLPMQDRLAIAKLALNFWEIDSARGNVINADQAMPDAELLRQAIIKAHLAVIEGKSGYVSAIIK